MSFGGCCKRERRSVNQVCTSARTQPARQRVASRTRPAWRRRRRSFARGTEREYGNPLHVPT